MTSNFNNIKVTGTLVTAGDTDTYATHEDNLGKGGIHSVQSLADRDAISFERRSFGMHCYVVDNGVLYALTQALDNTGWVTVLDFSSGVPIRVDNLGYGYIFLGDENNLASPSLILRDMDIDIISLKRRVDAIDALKSLRYGWLWVGNEYGVAKAVQQINVKNLPTLGAALFPYPDFIPSAPIPLPNPSFNPLSLVDLIMSGPWLPQVFAGYQQYNLPFSPETQISSTLAMTQIQVLQSLKRLENSRFVVSSKNVSWSWENPLANTIPTVIADLYNYNSTYTHSNSIALDELEAGLLKNVGDGGLVIASHGRVIGVDDYISPEELSASEAETDGKITDLQTAIESELVVIEGEIAEIQQELLIGGASLSAVVAGLQVEVSDLNNASIYTAQHITGSGKITPNGFDIRYINLYLAQYIHLANSEQTFVYDDAINNESSMTLMFDSDGSTEVKPLNFKFLSRENHIDLLQPTGRYNTYRGIKIQAQYGTHQTGASQPKGLYIKHLEYQDDKYYNSGGIIEHDLMVFDVDNEVLDCYVTLYLPTWTTVTRSQTPKRGYFGFNTDLDALEWYDSTGWHTISDYLTVVNGVDNQIVVNNNNYNIYTVGIADNAIFPGNEGVGIPIGTTAQRPIAPTDTSFRLNTDTNQFEYYNGAWFNVGGGDSNIVGTVNQIVIDKTNNVTTISFADNPKFTGNEYMLLPSGTTAQRTLEQLALIRYNTDTHRVELFTQLNNGVSATTLQWQDMLISADMPIFAGTQNQIDIVDTFTSQIGYTMKTFKIADNVVLPGNDAMTLPIGTSAHRGTPTQAKLRYNSDTYHCEYGIGGAIWYNIATTYDIPSQQGTTNQINVTTTTPIPIGSDPVIYQPQTTFSLADNAILPGNDAITVPSGTTAQRGTATGGKLRYNITLDQYEVVKAGAWVALGGGSGGGATVLGTANQITATYNAPSNTQVTVAIADNPVLTGTGCMILPKGTQSQKPAVVQGGFRFNVDLGSVEYSDGHDWTLLTNPKLAVISAYVDGYYTNQNTYDHIRYNKIITNTATGVINFDTTTAYTTAPNVASVGRFNLSVSGVYEVVVTLGSITMQQNGGAVSVFICVAGTNSPLIITPAGVSPYEARLYSVADLQTAYANVPQVLHTTIDNSTGLYSASWLEVAISNNGPTNVQTIYAGANLGSGAHFPPPQIYIKRLS